MRVNEKMHMSRPHRMAVGCLDQLADRSICRDWIAARQDGAEREAAVRVGDEASTQGRAVSFVAGFLRIVEAFVIGMPDVDRHVDEWRAVERRYPCTHEHRLAGHSRRDV